MTASTAGPFPTAREGRENVLHAMAAISAGLRQSAAEPGPQAPLVLAADAVADRSRDNILKTINFFYRRRS